MVSIVSVLEPVVTVESVIAAHVVIALAPLSSMAKLRVPHKSVNGADAVSTASDGTTNSAVAVKPSVTEIEVGLKVIWLTAVLVHGFPTVRV